MGLDMSLYRFPRFKNYGPDSLMAADQYFDWMADENAREKYTLEEWCGIEEGLLPDKNDLEEIRKLSGQKFYSWDHNKRYPYVGVRECVADWRKANEIHRWFVDRVQGGEDDCRFHEEVTEEILTELRDACKEILESAILVAGKIQNGYRIVDGKRIPIMVDGKYVLNPEICREKMPTQEGFFFGSTEYDEWYVSDIQHTYEVCSKLLEETDFEHQMIYYLSSW